MCDGDDTSVSSRASSRIFDDAMLSYDALSAYYQTDYDNFKGPAQPGSSLSSEPCGPDEDATHLAAAVGASNASSKHDVDACLDSTDNRLDKLDQQTSINFQDIRSVTESITLNFGAGRLETDLDSDV